jgi:hypothetical protein
MNFWKKLFGGKYSTKATFAEFSCETSFVRKPARLVIAVISLVGTNASHSYPNI